MGRYDLVEVNRSDFDQCLSRLQFDIITLLVNSSYELRPIMIKYDFDYDSQTSEFEHC